MKNNILFSSLLLLASQSLSVGAADTEFTAIWEQELAIDNDGNGQKFESLFEPEWVTSFDDNLEMTLKARLRIDTEGNLGPAKERPHNYSSINGPIAAGEHGDVSIREWFVDTEINATYWRIGKQQVVWGQADGLKVLDVVNPQSFREFILDDFEDSRIPLWTLNIEIPVVDDDSFQILWIPDQTYNEFAENGSTYQATSAILVPQLPPDITIGELNATKPSSMIKDSDLGFRYSKFYNGWDLTFNYLYHYHDSPVLYQSIAQDQVFIDSRYKRNHLLGATASKSFGDFTLRTEIGLSSDTYHLVDNSTALFLQQQGIHNSQEFASVIGLDWQGLENTMLSFQWFQSSLLDYQSEVIRPKTNQVLSLLYRQTFENEIWAFETLALHGLDLDDSSIQTKLSYMLESNIQLWLGADIFYGSSSGIFGQFDQTDRLTLGFEWGF